MKAENASQFLDQCRTIVTMIIIAIYWALATFQELVNEIFMY